MDPVAQRRGIGRALLTRVEAEVQARGGSLLLVETSSRPVYASAHRLYEICGYRCEATIHHFYALGDDLLIFSKNLGQAQPPRQPPGEYQQLVEDLSTVFPFA